jgi:hypothetical protein
MRPPSRTRDIALRCVLASAPLAIGLVAVVSCDGTERPNIGPPEPTIPFDAASDDAYVYMPPANDSSPAPIVDATTEIDAAADASTEAAAGDAESGSPVAVPDAGPCETGFAYCGGNCVNTQTDSLNCGNCGESCGGSLLCRSGHCACPEAQTLCNAQCTDVLTDKDNCGICGHGCETTDPSDCVAGVCQPRAIVAASPATIGIKDIAVDKTNVYWTTSGGGIAGVYFKAFAGGSIVTSVSATMIEPPINPIGIAVDSTSNVFWVDFNGAVATSEIVHGIPSAQTNYTFNSFDSPLPGAVDVTFDNTNVYWVDQLAQTVNQVARDGLSGPIHIATSPAPTAITVDARSGIVYWLDQGTSEVSGSVNSIAIGGSADGGIPTALASDEKLPCDLAVVAGFVYWTGTDPVLGGTVKRMPVDGSAGPTVLVQALYAPEGIAVDSTFVYWTNFNEGTVMKVELAGGTPFTLASGQNNPQAIVVDANSVYWSNAGDGTIWKVAK